MQILFNIFPIVLFFLTYKVANIYAATSIAIATTILQIFCLVVSKKKVDSKHWANLFLVTILGGSTLLLRNEAFIKCKPTIIYLLLAGLLITAEYRGKQPLKLIFGKDNNIPDSLYRHFSFFWAIFFILLALLNIAIAYYCSTNTWVSYKLFGNTGLILLVILIQSFFLANKSE